MTVNKKTRSSHYILCELLILIIIVFLLIKSEFISDLVHNGIMLSFNVIIGSVFPFMILTDIALFSIQNADNRLLENLFERVFKINGKAFHVLLCGILCGFPLGAGLADKLYNNNDISKTEFKRLVLLSTGSSPCFVISGIGAAMRGNIKEGLILYLSSLLATIIVSVITARNSSPTHSALIPQPAHLDLTDSIKKATATTISISGFVTLFSVVSGIINVLPLPKIIKLFIIPFFELSNAAKIISSTPYLTHGASLILTSFSIGFTGLCGILQVKSLISDKNIKLTSLLLPRLLIGAVSALITFIFLIIL